MRTTEDWWYGAVSGILMGRETFNHESRHGMETRLFALHRGDWTDADMKKLVSPRRSNGLQFGRETCVARCRWKRNIDYDVKNSSCSESIVFTVQHDNNIRV